PPPPLLPYTTLFRSNFRVTDCHGADLPRCSVGRCLPSCATCGGWEFNSPGKALHTVMFGAGHITAKLPRSLYNEVLPRCRRPVRSEEHTSELQSRFD